MNDIEPSQIQQDSTAAPRRRRRRWVRWLLILPLCLVLVTVTAGLMVRDREMAVPAWLLDQIETRLSVAMGQGDVVLGDVSMTLSLMDPPQIRVTDMALVNEFGATVARFDRIDAQLAALPLLQGKPDLRGLSLTGGALRIRRISDGTFDLAIGPEGDFGARGSVAEVLSAIDNAFKTPALSQLGSVRADGVALRFEDNVAGRVFRIEDGQLSFTRPAGGLKLQLTFDLNTGEEVTETVLTFTTDAPTEGLELQMQASNLRMADFAETTPVMAWAREVNAALAGAARLQVAGDGSLSGLSGTLTAKGGTISRGANLPPVRLQRGQVAFEMEPDSHRITLSNFEVETDAGRIAATGHAFISKGTLDQPDEIIGQVRISSALIEGQEHLSQTLAVDGGAVDLRLKLDPFELDVAQVMLQTEGHKLRGAGGLTYTDGHWLGQFDLRARQLSRDAFMAFWPVRVTEKTRGWLDDNVLAAVLNDVALGLRFVPDRRPIFATSFEFQDGSVRFLPTLPPVEKAFGRGAVQNGAFTLVLDSGALTVAEGATITLKDSLMRVPDLNVKSPPATFELFTQSTVTAALTLLDMKPFEFMSKGALRPDIIDGQANLTVRLALPLGEKVGVEDVDFDVTGRVVDLRSATLVPDRVLTSKRVRVKATPKGVSVTGPIAVGGAKARGTWSQAFGAEGRGRSRFEGNLAMDDALMAELALGLPKGSFSGQGQGKLVLDIRQDAPVGFNLTSDLHQIGLQVAPLGWSKSRNQTGLLEVAGTLGARPEITKLSLRAADLRAEGRVTVKANGGLDKAQFSRLAVGQWLDAGVTLTGRGKGQPLGVVLNGGKVDIRRTSLGAGTGANAGGGNIELNLDRLQMSDGIAITGFKGVLTQAKGLSGSFTGRVNGKARIKGTLAPGGNGTALRVRSDTAGDVLKAAGVLKNVTGGKMDLVLTPRKTAGSYTGRLEIAQARLVGASAMAELLNAISVVGLLDQLNGPGIQFTSVEADFVLSPKQVTLTKSAAVGPSMGISLHGIYDLATARMDMQGVVSPIYAINGIGQIFTRRGEGLFGFNFRLLGDAQDPKVQVNPLSILTPGMFREIFRRPPPKVPE